MRTTATLDRKRSVLDDDQCRSATMTFARLRGLLAVCSVLSVVAPAAPAHAGDRQVGVFLVGLGTAGEPDAFRDAVRTALVRQGCVAEACGHDASTSDFPFVFREDLPEGITPDLLTLAARGRRPSRTQLREIADEDSNRERSYFWSADGIVLYERVDDSRVRLTGLSLRASSPRRVVVRLREGADLSALAERSVRNALRPILRDFVP
jgi:hypothetical protein